LGWLDASWDEITAVIALAEEARPDPHPVSWLLVAALRDFMHHRRPLVEWVRIATTALAAARRAGEETGQAAMHLSLGTVRWRMAELPAAEHDFEQALALSQRAGWTKGEADALRGIGVVLKQLGRPREALPRYLDSVELDRRMGDRHGEAAGLNNLASAYHTLGKLDQAEDCLSACLHLVEMADDQYKVALTLVNLGLVHQEQGRLDDSLRCLDRSFVLARGSDLRYAEAITWEALGRVHNDAGRWAEAAKAHQKALVAASAVENRNCQVDSLVGLAEAETGRDDPDRALDHLDAAAEVIELTGYRTGRVEVLIGLARVNCRLGRHDQAYEDAVSALWLAQDGSPLTLSRAHHTLAEVLLELGDGAQADRECRQAAQLARRSGQLLAHARVLVALGHIHRRLGHERGARLAWRRAHLVFADLDIPRQAETASLLR
jgi:tetratricopeptide (TPR) repeat protein